MKMHDVLVNKMMRNISVQNEALNQVRAIICKWVRDGSSGKIIINKQLVGTKTILTILLFFFVASKVLLQLYYSYHQLPIK
jgi:putative transposon-encoded protein